MTPPPYTLSDPGPDRPVLIMGPTASGKSKLALDIAQRFGGTIINADAIQVFENWRILSARPGPEELSQASHALYGHKPWDAPYSVGHWLRDVTALLDEEARPIIVGGTGLYFTALTEGLAGIPSTPPEIRREADAIRTTQGHAAMLGEIDDETLARLDTRNPMRVQRAWEVQQATGRGLAQWHREKPTPLLPRDAAQAFVVNAPRDWLSARIAQRFDQMLASGALDEVRANLAHLDGSRGATPLSMKAIGAAELSDYLRGNCTLDDARARAITATMRYAKRQRTWMRSRMGDWCAVDPSA